MLYPFLALFAAFTGVWIIFATKTIRAQVNKSRFAPTGSLERQFAIDRAFRIYWPYKSERIHAWVLELDDASYADVWHCMDSVAEESKSNNSDGRPAMLEHFKQAGIAQDWDIAAIRQMGITDCRVLAQLMKAA